MAKRSYWQKLRDARRINKGGAVFGGKSGPGRLPRNAWAKPDEAPDSAAQARDRAVVAAFLALPPAPSLPRFVTIARGRWHVRWRGPCWCGRVHYGRRGK